MSRRETRSNQTVIIDNSLRTFPLYGLFTLGNPISDLTEFAFLLQWHEQARPLTCSVIKEKQSPSISCHYCKEEGRTKRKREENKKLDGFRHNFVGEKDGVKEDRNRRWNIDI